MVAAKSVLLEDVEWWLQHRKPLVRDGLELSANLWLPVATRDAPVARFPVLLEMIPYGKDTWHRAADVAMGEFLAARDGPQAAEGFDERHSDS